MKRLSIVIPAYNVNKYIDVLLNSIFEPGFSGKGEGRGMGLHIARETMRGAAGDLTVESNEEYTAFRGFLPKPLIAKEEENAN